MGAAYNAYRRGVMDLVANSQNFLGELAGPNDMGLAKLAEARADEMFTPLSVAYIQNAFMDEFGQAPEIKLSQACASVERGSPSKNTLRVLNARRFK